MKCVFCKHGKTKPGLTTITLDRDNCIVVLKGVPADICENCGEYYLSETTTESILEYAEVVADRGTEVEIMRFAA